jgi:pyruvate formate lyase activating enzyme
MVTWRMSADDVAVIFEIQKYSTEDGPGIRTTVFFKQCPLRCAWCQNPEGIDKLPSLQWYKGKCIGCETCVKTCPAGAITIDEDGIHIDRTKCTACGTCAEECPSTAMKLFGESRSVETLLDEVGKDAAYYERSGGGVTASGGEPLVQAGFLARFFERCKSHGISTAIETCGLASKSAFEKVLPQVDLVMYDIKEIDPDKHEAFTGVRNDAILENCAWLAETLKDQGKPLWIRTPLVPGYTATDENVLGIAAFILDRLGKNIDRWDLLAFNNLPADKYERMDIGPWVFKGTPLLSKEDMGRYCQIATQAGVPNVHGGGLVK